MKSIKTKILVYVIASIVVVAAAVGTVSATLSYQSTIDTLDTTLTQLAVAASGQVSAKLDNYKTIAAMLGSDAHLSETSVSSSEKKEILSGYVEDNGLIDAFIADASGKVLTAPDMNVGSEEYFKEALAGESFIQNPVVDTEKKTTRLYVAAPIWKDGIHKGTVSGVAVIVLDGELLSQMSDATYVSNAGAAFVVNNEGTVIAHQDRKKLYTNENAINQQKTVPALKPLADILRKMIVGETGFGAYSYGGVDKFLSYAPIKGTNGWGLGINVLQDSYTNSIYIVTLWILAISCVIVFAGAALAYLLANSIAKPIKACANRLSLLAEGDLHTAIPATRSKDETAVLITALTTTVNKLNEAISDVSYHMNEIASGNLTTSVDIEYDGDLKPLEISTREIIRSLNEDMKQIEESAQQITNGSGEVANGAQALAQGATEQASSVEELSATIVEVSSQVAKNAQNASSASRIAAKNGIDVQEGNQQMQSMIEAMNEINSTSKEISKIIKSIEDIAFQTNILALNAAVEAARAGEAGKGFAVVADEVRNLASKSAEAANSTTALIESTMMAIDKGAKIANRTAQTLNGIVEGTKQSAALIEEIAVASGEQANSILQITQGIEQISTVVQTNSATSEESAAASEELSSQAQMLKNLVEHFKLKA